MPIKAVRVAKFANKEYKKASGTRVFFRFLDADGLKLALRVRNVSGAFENGPQTTFVLLAYFRKMRNKKMGDFSICKL